MRLLSSLLFFALGLSIGSVISAVREQPLPEAAAAAATDRVSASATLPEQRVAPPVASPAPAAAPSPDGCGAPQASCVPMAEGALRG